MFVKKYWVVINNKYQPELLENITWNEDQNEITSGQLYSGFTTQKEAKEVFNKLNAAYLEYDPAKEEKKIEDQVNNLQDGEIILFTGGSYRDVDPKKYGTGWGYVSLHKEKGKLIEKSESGFVLTSDSRQINGETSAISNALLHANILGCTKVNIYCNLLDLILWDCGFNKANIAVAKDYVKSMEYYHHKLNITFHWVPSHKEIEYNKKANAEAKDGFKSAPTKVQLLELLDQLQDELKSLYDSLQVYYYSDSDFDDAHSAIGDTWRLTDNQDAYESAIDDYSQWEISNKINEHEQTIVEIKKALGINI